MTKKAKTAAKTNEGPLPAAIKESAQQIWSAGVGAITRAHQQSNRVFDALVREGESLRENIHKKTRNAPSVTDVTSRATDTWDKLEQVFEKRVERALATLGVPTRSELADLNKRLDALTKLVRQQSGAATGAATKSSTTAAPRKSAARKTAI